jgi:YggT family protein
VPAGIALARAFANVYMSVNREMETSMSGILLALFQVIDIVLQMYVYILIASAIFSWLYAFNVINSSNQFVNSVGRFLYNVTEPVLAPLRRVLPNLGGIDISPIVVLLIIFFIQAVLHNTVYPALLQLTL